MEKDNPKKWRQVNLKLTDEEWAYFDGLKTRLDALRRIRRPLTAKDVVWEALARLDAYMAKLERDRSRDR